MALILLTVILERIKVYVTDPRAATDASYKLNVVGIRGWGM